MSVGKGSTAWQKEIGSGAFGPSLVNEPLSRHSSWRIGGPADLLIEPETVAQIIEIVRLAQLHQCPLVVIGQGSNLLFDDAGVRGIVLKIGARLADLRISGTTIHAQAGVWVPQLARRAMRAGLGGLEHCIGIPGTLGGLVLMNGGSRRQAIGEHIEEVRMVDRQARLQTYSREQCRFAYRRSALQGEGGIVVDVRLSCPRRAVAEIRAEMRSDLRERRRKFPRKQPNCGSVFLSSAQMHATIGPPGRVIEDAGLKGLRRGQAEVSRQHANFIVNLGGARASQVLELIAHIRQVVRRERDFELDCEVRYVSPTGCVAPAHLTAERLFPGGVSP